MDVTTPIIFPFIELDYESWNSTNNTDTMSTDIGDTTYKYMKYLNYTEVLFDIWTTTIIPLNVTRKLQTRRAGVFESKLIIPLYTIIFILAITGNSLVIITLVRNKRMRTVTNVYLLNLAISDLLLGVFCVPFTLVGQVLRRFIFGAVMCKLIPYIQAVSVSVGVWTLVAISLERYFAICKPLKSRRWQTQCHAYKMIAVVWVTSILWTSPILGVSKLKSMRGKGYKCREEWPSHSAEQAFNILLDFNLLLVPSVIMTLAYSLICNKLWKGLQMEIKHNTTCQKQLERSYSSGTVNGIVHNDSSINLAEDLSPGGQQTALPRVKESNRNYLEKKPVAEDKKRSKEKSRFWSFRRMTQVSILSSGKGHKTDLASNVISSATEDGTIAGDPAETTYTFTRHAIRSNYMDKSIEAKKNVIKMLFVIIAEFFICWAPLHALNTIYLFAPEWIYNYIGSTGVALIQLLAYVSSCCNPITYCFMNKKFRQAFLNIFNYEKLRCSSCGKAYDEEENIRMRNAPSRRSGNTPQNNSDVSGNDSAMYTGRASTLRRTEITFDSDERV